MKLLEEAVLFYKKNVNQQTKDYLLNERGFKYLPDIKEFLSKEEIGCTSEKSLTEHLLNHTKYNAEELVKKRLSHFRNLTVEDLVPNGFVAFPRRNVKGEVVSIYYKEIKTKRRAGTGHVQTTHQNIDNLEFLKKMKKKSNVLIVEGDINFFIAKALGIQVIDISVLGLRKIEMEMIKERNLTPIFYIERDQHGCYLLDTMSNFLNRSNVKVKTIGLEGDLSDLLRKEKTNMQTIIEEKINRAPYYLGGVFK